MTSNVFRPGSALPRVLANAGAKVALAARRLDRLQRLETEIHAAGGRHPPWPSMLPTAHQSPRLFNTAEAALGQVTMLVNNAGMQAGSYFLKMSEERMAQRDQCRSRRRLPRSQEAARRMNKRTDRAVRS